MRCLNTFSLLPKALLSLPPKNKLKSNNLPKHKHPLYVNQLKCFTFQCVKLQNAPILSPFERVIVLKEDITDITHQRHVSPKQMLSAITRLSVQVVPMALCCGHFMIQSGLFLIEDIHLIIN